MEKPIEGDLKSSEAADTAEVSGQVEVTGKLETSEGVDGMAATGTVSD